MSILISVLALYTVSPFFRLLHAIRAKRTNAPVVLVWYTGKLGDLVCLTGVMKAFRETRFGSKIILIARAPFTDILANNPNIDEIVQFKTDRDLASLSWLVSVWKRISTHPVKETHVLIESPEAAVDGLWFDSPVRRLLVTTNRRSTKTLLSRHYTLHPFPYDCRIKHWYLSEFAGVKPSDERYPNELFFPGIKDTVAQRWDQAGMGQFENVVGVLPSSGKGFKRWPEVRWRNLVEILDGLGCGIVFFGAGKNESDLIDRLQSSVRSKSLKVVDAPLTDVPYYLKTCSLVVGVDTGLIYIADALGIPVVDIMGPVDEVQQRPEHQYRLVSNLGKCSKIVKTPPHRVMTHQDLVAIARCFESITVQDVFEAVQSLLYR